MFLVLCLFCSVVFLSACNSAIPKLLRNPDADPEKQAEIMREHGWNVRVEDGDTFNEKLPNHEIENLVWCVFGMKFTPNDFDPNSTQKIVQEQANIYYFDTVESAENYEKIMQEGLNKDRQELIDYYKQFGVRVSVKIMRNEKTCISYARFSGRAIDLSRS